MTKSTNGNKANNALTQISVELDFPVSIVDADGKEAVRPVLVLRRPKTRHVKQLAALIGADMVRLLVNEAETGAGGDQRLDMERLAPEIAKTIFRAEHLDELTRIVADMCDETPGLIDDLDPADLVKLMRAFTGFFPSLQSFGPMLSQPS